MPSQLSKSRAKVQIKWVSRKHHLTQFHLDLRSNQLFSNALQGLVKLLPGPNGTAAASALALLASKGYNGGSFSWDFAHMLSRLEPYADSVRNEVANSAQFATLRKKLTLRNTATLATLGT